MRVDTLSFHNTDDNLNLVLEEIAEELTKLIQAAPFPVWPGKAKNEQHYGSTQMLNALFKELLNRYGWDTSFKTANHKAPDAFKTFKSIRVWVEIQLANSARTSEDLIKFMQYKDQNVADVFVSIQMTAATAKVCASNVANYQGLQRQIENLGKRLDNVSIICIGISHEGCEHVDMRPFNVEGTSVSYGRNPLLCEDMAKRILSKSDETAAMRCEPVQGCLF